MLTNQVRIIGGDWRGRKLPIIQAPQLRPTPDRVRETLFNWLMRDIHDAVCLDAFAGTGALGFEALSRGAKHVSFVDNAKNVVQQIQDNCTTLDCTEKVSIQQRNFLDTRFTEYFDIIFLDPPFNCQLLSDCLSYSKSLLSEQGLIYVESESKVSFDSDFEVLKAKQAGQVHYYLLKNLL